MYKIGGSVVDWYLTKEARTKGPLMWNRTRSDVDNEAYEDWCMDQGLDPMLDYWPEWDEARAEARAELRYNERY